MSTMTTINTSTTTSHVTAPTANLRSARMIPEDIALPGVLLVEQPGREDELQATYTRAIDAGHTEAWLGVGLAVATEQERTLKALLAHLLLACQQLSLL